VSGNGGGGGSGGGGGGGFGFSFGRIVYIVEKVTIRILEIVCGRVYTFQSVGRQLRHIQAFVSGCSCHVFQGWSMLFMTNARKTIQFSRFSRQKIVPVRNVNFLDFLSSENRSWKEHQFLFHKKKC
jgi:hypothetical protein